MIFKDFGKSKLKEMNFSLPDLGIALLTFCQEKKLLKKYGHTLTREEENEQIKHPQLGLKTNEVNSKKTSM